MKNMPSLCRERTKPKAATQKRSRKGWPRDIGRINKKNSVHGEKIIKKRDNK